MTFRFTLLLAAASIQLLSAQEQVVRIHASVQETHEPAPNIRIQPGRFVISREGGDPSSPLAVHLEYSGSATPGEDYAPLPEWVTIPEGATDTDLFVEPFDDGEIEGDEVVAATLTMPTSIAPGYRIDPDHDQARVVIHDNGIQRPDLPVVRVFASSWQTSEPCPTCFVAPAVFRFLRSEPADGALTVFFHTDGTATPQLDYAPLPGSVEIPAGETAAEVRLLPKDDQLVEGPEVVRVRLIPAPANARPYRIDPDPEDGTALAVIGDDEAGAPEARLDFVFPKDGDHFPRGPRELSVIGVWTQGEIDKGVDFYDGEHLIGSTPPSFSLRPPIPGLPSVHTFRWAEPGPGLHTLTATSELGSDQRVISDPIQITIGDEPPPSLVRIEATRRIAEETSAPLRRIRFDGLFTISRTGSTDHDQPVWVHYSGSSTPGEDYPALPLLVSIPAGASSVELPVEAILDEIPEPIETLVATLSDCPPPPLKAPCYEVPIDPAHQQATLFIRDDGLTRATLDLSQPEAGAHFESPPIHLEAVAIDLEGYISRVEFWADEQRIGVSEIFFLVAPDPGTPIVHAFEWLEPLPGEHILTARARLGLDTTELTVISQPVPITVGSLPSEQVVLEIIATDSVAQEPGPNRPADPARFTIRRSAGPLNIAVAAFYLVDGTAENGVDYEQLIGEVLLPAGARSVDVVVNPLPDEQPEGEETVVARLVPTPCLPPPSPDCYLVGPHEAARVVIQDLPTGSEPPHAVITRPESGAEFEPGAPVGIRVEAVDPDGYVRRAVFLADGQHIGEQNIEFVQAPEPGQTQVFEFVWKTPLPGPHRLSVVVTDNAGEQGTSPPVEILVLRAEPLPLVAVLSLDAFAREPGEERPVDIAYFGIVRFGPSEGPLEVNYSLGGTAQNGLDYGELSGRVVIPAGRETAQVVLVPLADEELEGLETVGLRLSESPHYNLVPDHREVRALIADNHLLNPGTRCIALSDGSVYLCFPTSPGRPFRIEGTFDLRTWITLLAGTASEDEAHFVDDSKEHRYRFYRLVTEE